MKIGTETLIYDLETQIFDSRPNPNKDRLKIFGCYSYKTNKTYLLKKKDDIQKIINAHKFLVGFNNERYDNPILQREGYNLQYKIIIDLQKIFIQRAAIMKIKEGMLKDLLMKYSLDYITRTLGIVDDSTAKEKIDYSLFKKEYWTIEETKKILKYTERDIDVTKKLYEFVEEYFETFATISKDVDVKNKKYLTDSPAVFTYKVICKELGINPEFDNIKTEHGDYKGGYVAYPAGEKFSGNLALFDFSSLYPNIFIQCNLFSNKCDCCEHHEKWHGGGFFKVDGYYCSKKQGKVEQFYKKFYLQRQKYKKEKNPLEYSYKIVLNMGYGVTGNPSFKQVYNRDTASDCTAVGRQMILYTRKRFREEGYRNIFTDTDSVGIQFPEGKTIEDAKELAKKIVKEVQQYMPFSWSEFELALEHELKYAFFFKGDKNKNEINKYDDEDDFTNQYLGLLKKNYILVTKDDKLIIKNLGIRKKSNSTLSRKIFWDYLVPQIIKTGTAKFNRVTIKNIIDELLEKDLSLALVRRDVNDPETYPSKTSIQFQIAEKYGGGIHFLMPNTRGVGVGKGKQFCTLEEFNEKGLKISDIDLSGVWSELEYFIKPVIMKNIFDYVKKDE